MFNYGKRAKMCNAVAMIELIGYFRLREKGAKGVQASSPLPGGHIRTFNVFRERVVQLSHGEQLY